MNVLEIDWWSLVDEWLPKSKVTSMNDDFDAQAAWEGLTDEERSNYRNYTNGARFVGRARDLRRQFNRDHGWTTDQGNAVTRHMMTLPFWTETFGANPPRLP